MDNCPDIHVCRGMKSKKVFNYQEFLFQFYMFELYNSKSLFKKRSSENKIDFSSQNTKAVHTERSERKTQLRYLQHKNLRDEQYVLLSQNNFPFIYHSR